MNEAQRWVLWLGEVFNVVLRFLTWTQLAEDHDGLSWTNIAVVVVIAKIAFVQNASVVDLGALLGTLLAKAHKRHLNRDKVDLRGQIHTATETAGQAMELCGRMITRQEQFEQRLSIVDNRTKTPAQRLQG